MTKTDPVCYIPPRKNLKEVRMSLCEGKASMNTFGFYTILN
jgi:hypothetical protein